MASYDTLSLSIFKEFKVIKRGLIILLLALIAAGGAFGQNMPKNTITVDLGPTALGLGINAAFKLMEKSLKNSMDSVEGDFGINNSGFGIGAQYELQPFEKVSFAARFAYLGLGVGFTETYGGVYAKANFDLSSFSVEGHARFYPFSKGVFFLDGMAGYGRLMVDVTGAVVINDYGINHAESVSLNPSRNYFKYGGKLGWRKGFGKNGGGFTFEPSLGWYGRVGLGDSIGRQINNSVVGAIADEKAIDDVFSIAEKFLFIGGPRVSLALGWRF